ncbi:MAG: serine/threonine-protein phosphatase [Deltaproteobacteria bacterium]|nr:MAG: serine/threonine-protein phosphatase [Deltaproteobacteria bacterium]
MTAAATRCTIATDVDGANAGPVLRGVAPEGARAAARAPRDARSVARPARRPDRARTDRCGARPPGQLHCHGRFRAASWISTHLPRDARRRGPELGVGARDARRDRRHCGAGRAHPRDRDHGARGQRPDRGGARAADRPARRAGQARARGCAVSEGGSRSGDGPGRGQPRGPTEPAAPRFAGDSHVGKVRTTNEDTLILEPGLGLYAVLDGMGGASAGDVASQLARDAIRDFVLHRRPTLAPRALIEEAIAGATAAVFGEAQRHRERHGMGTTVVACLVIDLQHVVIAHVGDSRAYLWRDGRLQALTRDHTIVEELVGRGLLSPEEAERHPHKNVLSRNLGGKPETRVDSLELELRPGDRLLLCSDGLHGYASAEAIQYLLGSGDAPEHVARDLIELALRGGGGDNVTVVVIEGPPAAPSSTQVVRTSGALAWWQNRQRFLQVASDRGLTSNPIVRGLPPGEALELVALSLCQAIYHDLEKSTGVNVWTFAQNLAAGWFERGGDWRAVRGIIDVLGTSARVVVDDIRAADATLGFLLDVAVSRALIVVELVDAELIALHTAAQDTALDTAQDTIEQTTEESIELPERASERFIDRPTIPFLRPDRPITSTGESAELLEAIGRVITLARGRVAPRAVLLGQVLIALESVAGDSAGNFAAAVLAARELYGVRSADNAGVMPLHDALDQARILVAASVQQLRAQPAIRVRVLRALSTAHQRLVGATTGLVLEAVNPITDRLREVQAVTAELRDEVARAERRRADLERKFATIVDPSLRWGARGSSEWYPEPGWRSIVRL